MRRSSGWCRGNTLPEARRTCWHQQARELLSSQAAHPWSACGSRTHEARTCALRGWLNGLEKRAPRNVAVTATANKLARIAWAVLSSGKLAVQASSCHDACGLSNRQLQRKNHSLPTEVCTGTAKTNQQSQRRACNLLQRQWSLRPFGLLEQGTRGTHLGQEKNSLHLKVGYIDADCFLRPSALPLQSPRTIHCRTDGLLLIILDSMTWPGTSVWGGEGVPSR